MHLRRLLTGPALVMLFAVAVALPLLLLNQGDGSYSCRAGALVDVVHPEPEQSVSFRQNFFDDGRQCNRQAREQVLAAGIVIAVGGLGSAAWSGARRRRSRG